MKKTLFISFVLCCLPALSSAMEKQELTRIPSLTGMPTKAEQSPRDQVISPRKTAISNTYEQVVKTTTDEEYDKIAQRYVIRHERTDAFIKYQFPALFLKNSELQDYCADLTLNESLQLALIKNDLAKVQYYLMLVEYCRAFKPATEERLDEQIELIEELKVIMKQIENPTLENYTDMLNSIRGMHNSSKAVIFLAGQEVSRISGPAALRMPLTELCGSPNGIEKKSEVCGNFKKDLIIGLCAILLPAHVLKASMIKDETARQKYLDDLSAINTAMWQAYENNPNKLDRLLNLHDTLSSLEEACLKKIKRKTNQLHKSHRKSC